MTVRRARLALLCLVLLTAADASGAQAVARAPSGTWSARSSAGLALMGAWTAVPDTATGAVTGTWTLLDARGATVASGAWSASKSPTRWNGAWRAVVAGRPGELAGTWTADATLKRDAPFVDLLESAVQAIVSGDWRAGGRAGAWSIRTAPR